MIIDIHSHIKLDGQQPLFQDMDKNGIDYRIVSCLSEPDTKIANKFVEELVSAHPDRLGGCAVINPKQRDCAEECERFLENPAMKMVEFNSLEHSWWGLAVQSLMLQVPFPVVGKSRRSGFHSRIHGVLECAVSLHPDVMPNPECEHESPLPTAIWKRLAARNVFDLRSFERQGIQQIPTVHLGPAAHQMEKRGVETFLGNLNRDIRAANSLMQSIRSAIRGLQRWIADLNEKKQILLDALEQANT